MVIISVSQLRYDLIAMTTQYNTLHPILHNDITSHNIMQFTAIGFAIPYHITPHHTTPHHTTPHHITLHHTSLTSCDVPTKERKHRNVSSLTSCGRIIKVPKGLPVRAIIASNIIINGEM